jgi:hypothetical protein
VYIPELYKREETKTPLDLRFYSIAEVRSEKKHDSISLKGIRGHWSDKLIDNEEEKALQPEKTACS